VHSIPVVINPETEALGPEIFKNEL